MSAWFGCLAFTRILLKLFFIPLAFFSFLFLSTVPRLELRNQFVFSHLRKLPCGNSWQPVTLRTTMARVVMRVIMMILMIMIQRGCHLENDDSGDEDHDSCDDNVDDYDDNDR